MTTTVAAHEDNNGEDNLLFRGRLVLIRREGNIVYARSLRRGEEDTGEGIHLNPGDQLVIPEGELVIDSRDIDDLIEEDLGGYKTIFPVIHIFSSFRKDPIEQKKILFAIGRWMDSTYLHWKNFTMAIDDTRNATGDKKAISFHKAWGSAEQAVITLHRLNELVKKFNRNFGGIKVPNMLKKSSKTVQRLRGKIEHSDEQLFKGITTLVPASREDGSHTLAIAYVSEEEGNYWGLDVESIIQPLIDLRKSIVDSLGYSRT